MIPKIIHYCWLSEDEMPDETKACIQSWKNILSGYEFVLWDSHRFDITSVQFVSEACISKKWAFASDYIRLYAVYTEGGIYLDTDVFIHKDFSEFLKYDFFSCVEYAECHVKKNNSLSLLNSDGLPIKLVHKIPGIAVQAAVFGGKKGHNYLRDCMDWYETNSFLSPDGGGYNIDFIAPNLYAKIAEKYGFRYKNELQELKDGMVIFPSWLVAGDQSLYVPETFATHMTAHSWYNYSFPEKIKKSKPYKTISKNKFLRKLFGKQ